MTEILYSTKLSQITYSVLSSSLEELLLMKNAEVFNRVTNGIVNLNETNLIEYEKVWRRWFDMKVEGTNNICKEREMLLASNPGLLLALRITINASHINTFHLPRST